MRKSLCAKALRRILLATNCYNLQQLAAGCDYLRQPATTGEKLRQTATLGAGRTADQAIKPAIIGPLGEQLAFVDNPRTGQWPDKFFMLLAIGDKSIMPKVEYLLATLRAIQ